MSDTETLGDGEEPERPAKADEPAVEEEGLVIIPGDSQEADDEGLEIISGDPEASDDEGLVIIPGGGVDDAEEEPLQVADASGSTAPEEPTAPEESGSAAEGGDSTEPHFTLDELVAEMADVSTVASDGSGPEAPAPVVAERIDVLETAMSDTFAEAPPVEAVMWTRLPFWVLGAVWVISVGVLTFMLWPTAKAGLAGQLYDVLVFGGAGLVVVSAVAGAVIWFRARSQAEMADRAIVRRAVLLRALGWTALGVALWVVSMVVLSLHSLDVIP
jgi:hypothetical protein